MATTKADDSKTSDAGSYSKTNFQKDGWSGKTTFSDLQGSYVDGNLESSSQYPMQQATGKLHSITGITTLPIPSTAFSQKQSDLKTKFVSSESKMDTVTNQDNIGIPNIEISKTVSSPVDLTPTQSITKFTSVTNDVSSVKNVPKSIEVLNLKQSKTFISSDSSVSLQSSDSISKSDKNMSSTEVSGSKSSGEKSAVTPVSFPFTDIKQVDITHSSTLAENNYSPEVSPLDNGTGFIVPLSTPNIQTSSKPSIDHMAASEFYSQFHSQYSKGFPDFQSLSGETIQTISPTATMTSGASVPVTGPKISSSLPPPPAVIPPDPISTTSGDGNGTSVSSTATPGYNALFANNYPLVIGVALCGAGIIIFLLILCVICCRKKKPKTEKQPHAQMQDLWVDTHGGEIPLTPGLDSVHTFESVSDVGPNNEKKSAILNEPKSAKKSKKQKNSKKNKNKSEGSTLDQVKVIHPFKPTIEGQLEINRDDIITVIQRDENGWWKGKLGDRIGWFPGSFVKEIDIDSGKKAGSSVAKDSGSTAVSSFLLSKDKKKAPPVPTRGDYNVHRYSDSRLPQKLAMGKEVPIPKVPEPPKQNNEVKIDLEVLSPKTEAFDHNIEGRKFKALYSYVSNFKEELDMVAGEVITGLEKDRNGWMKGRKKSGEEGWVPSVYMEEIASSPRPTQQVYEQLHSNQTPGISQDLLGIVHKATCPYAAERPEDLSFDTGDTVVVFDTLENGWWLGCRGEDVGWFPGSYVEAIHPRWRKFCQRQTKSLYHLVKEDIPEVVVEAPSSDKERKPVITNSTFDDHIKSLPLKSDSVLSQTSDSNMLISPLKSDISELSAYRSEDEHSISSGSTIDSRKSPASRPKPARKAPAPPTDSVKGSTVSKIPRFGNMTPQSSKKELLPISPINTTLSTSTADSEKDTESVFSVSEMSKSEMDNESKKQKNSVQTEKSGPSSKPEVPKRFVKPKVIKVPCKSKSQQYINDRYNQKIKPPPPPRPHPPKYLPRKSADSDVLQKEEKPTVSLKGSQNKSVAPNLKESQNNTVKPSLGESQINSVKPESKPRSKIPTISREDSGDNPNMINIVQNKTDQKVKDAYMESFGESVSDSFNISGITSFSSDLSFNNEENNAKGYTSFKAPSFNRDADVSSKSFLPDEQKSIEELYAKPNKNHKNVKNNQVTDGTDLNTTGDDRIQSDHSNLRDDENVNEMSETQNKISDSVSNAGKSSRIPKLPRQISQPSASPQQKRLDDSEIVGAANDSESQRQTRIPSISKIAKPKVKNKSDQSKTGLQSSDSDDLEIKTEKPNLNIKSNQSKSGFQSSDSDGAEFVNENKNLKQEPLPSPKKPSRIPQSPKQSRLPMFNKDNKKRDKSVEKLEEKRREMHREASPSAQKPPVAPKPKVIPVHIDYHQEMKEPLEVHLDSNADELFHTDDVHMKESLIQKQDISLVDSGVTSFEPVTATFSETSPVTDLRKSHKTPTESKSNIPVTSKSAKKSPTLKSKSQIPMSSGRKQPVAKKRNTNSPSNREVSELSNNEEPTNGKTAHSGYISDETSSSSGKTKPPRPDKPPSRSGSQSDDGTKLPKTKPSRPDKPPSRSGSQSDDASHQTLKSNLNQGEKTPEVIVKSKIPSKAAEKSPSRIPKSHHSTSVQGQNVSPERSSRSRLKKGSSIPKMKPSRPQPQRSLSPEEIDPAPVRSTSPGLHQVHDSSPAEQSVDRLPKVKKTLRRAIRSYHAQNDDELSFGEGSFIKEIEDSENSEETKWRVGMLADGTIGLFHISFVEDSPAQKQSVV